MELCSSSATNTRSRQSRSLACFLPTLTKRFPEPLRLAPSLDRSPFGVISKAVVSRIRIPCFRSPPRIEATSPSFALERRLIGHDGGFLGFRPCGSCRALEGFVGDLRSGLGGREAEEGGGDEVERGNPVPTK